MAKKAYHLFFQKQLIKEPIMFVVARDLNLLLNIRRAKITSEVGEATIELEGDEKDIAKAEKIFREKGVKVESVLGDIVEG
ncbi:MAG: NIL domain-containing protein [Candidatus Omnitrophica bacterium]|nr:NIL domain-containing protein [Candidatus Omnitrophota bacterium]